jgi:RNA polymerase sigma factor (sigma-70 family)
VPYSAPDQSSENDNLPEREVDIVNHVVRDFLSARRSHPDLELEDLVQECLIHWWQQRSSYDQSWGASIETFLRRVVKAKLIDLERGARAQKRGSGRSPGSLDQPLNEDEPESETLGDTIADPANTEWEALHQVSLEAALSRLSSRQREIIAGLREEYTVSQISKRLGVPRATLYDQLKRIRQIFQDEGLNQFLDESDS